MTSQTTEETKKKLAAGFAAAACEGISKDAAVAVTVK